MANIMGQGQIQVGPSHQARLPFYQPDIRPEDMLEQCASHETLFWLPDAITDGDLLMFLRAARSMAAFVGWCDGGSTDDGCAAASMDEITINSLQLLHQHGYDTGKALQALVKVINPKSVDKRWSDDDAKKICTWSETARQKFLQDSTGSFVKQGNASTSRILLPVEEDTSGLDDQTTSSASTSC